jgi:hypothetical protein
MSTDSKHSQRQAHHSPLGANGRWRSQSGQAMVEFALVLPIILVLLFGIAYFGVALNDWIDETQITSEGARFAEVNENCIVKGSPHQCEVGVREEAAFLKWLTEQGDNGQVRGAVATMCSPTSKLEDYVEVKLTYKYKWLPLLAIHGAETPVTSTARMKIEKEPYVPYPTTC